MKNGLLITIFSITSLFVAAPAVAESDLERVKPTKTQEIKGGISLQIDQLLGPETLNNFISFAGNKITDEMHDYEADAEWLAVYTDLTIFDRSRMDGSIWLNPDHGQRQWLAESGPGPSLKTKLRIKFIGLGGGEVSLISGLNGGNTIGIGGRVRW